MIPAEPCERFGYRFMDCQSCTEGIARGQAFAVFILLVEGFGFLFRREVAEDPARESRYADGLCRHIPMLSVYDVEGSVLLQGYGQRGAFCDVPICGDAAIVIGNEFALDGRVRFKKGEREILVVGSADLGGVGHNREGKGALVEGGVGIRGVGVRGVGGDFGVGSHGDSRFLPVYVRWQTCYLSSQMSMMAL